LPVRNGDLAGDKGGGVAETVVKDLEDILGILDSDGVAHPVVEDEQVNLFQGAQQAGVRAILAGQGKSVEETRDAVVTDCKSAASCGSAKGAGDVCFAAAGKTKHQEVVAVGDPIAQAESENSAPVEAAGEGEVKIFESGLHRESGGVELARRVVAASSKDVLIAGDVGPLGVRIAPFGRVQPTRRAWPSASRLPPWTKPART